MYETAQETLVARIHALLWLSAVFQVVISCWIFYSGVQQSDFDGSRTSNLTQERTHNGSAGLHRFTSRSVQCDSDGVLASMRSEACFSACERPKCSAMCPDVTRGLRVVVSHEHRFIYVDVHKSASTTVRVLLSRVFGARMSYERALMRPPDLPRDRDEYRSTDIRSEVYRKYFVFTFVRDPAARFESALAQLVRDQGRDESDSNSIESFGLGVLKDLLRGKKINAHLNSQIMQITGSTKDHERITYDFIGRVEYMYRDFMFVMTRLGRRALPAIPRSNRQLRGPNAKYNSSSTSTPSDDTTTEITRVLLAQKICATYAADYACFGYQVPKACIDPAQA